MVKRLQILVIGHNKSGCRSTHEQAAYEVGSEVAKASAVLVTGGLGGVMEAASRGASESGGLVVGILPQNDASCANAYCDVVIPTGLGLSRDFVNALTADGIIIVGGGSGTLSEICAAYMYNKPMVAIRNLDSVADPYIGGYLDYRCSVMIRGADTPQEAVKIILHKIKEKEQL